MQLPLSVLVALSVLQIHLIQYCYAAPSPQFTYVAFGIDGELPAPLNSDPSATEWVVPIGTDAAGDETTYLFNEVATVVVEGPSSTFTTHTTETGTLVASASGFTVSVISTGIQGLKGDEAECHYTAADNGVCVQNLYGEGDLLSLEFTGYPETRTMSISSAASAVVTPP